MATLSLAMIVKNEEDVLERCLSSVQNIVDEIIIVDTGSTDSTKNIAKKFTDKIYDFTWINDFAAARNFAFDKASKEYVMWLDADDIIDEKNQKVLITLKSELINFDVIMAKYDVGFDESGNTTFSFYRERILNRNFGFKWEGFIHECIAPFGRISYSDLTITHKKEKQNEPKRNLKIYEYHIKNGKTLKARDQFYYARELMFNSELDKAIVEYEKFLDSKIGLKSNNVEACINLYNIHRKLGKNEKGFLWLLKSLCFSSPSPEVNCLIADYFLETKDYSTAIYWYDCAINSKYTDSSSFIKLDYQKFYPYIQLCVCYDRLGDKVKAKSYNELAADIKPDNASVIYNKDYFKNLEKVTKI